MLIVIILVFGMDSLYSVYSYHEMRDLSRFWVECTFHMLSTKALSCTLKQQVFQCQVSSNYILTHFNMNKKNYPCKFNYSVKKLKSIAFLIVS